jgi:hypothetical protein
MALLANRRNKDITRGGAIQCEDTLCFQEHYFVGVWLCNPCLSK